MQGTGSARNRSTRACTAASAACRPHCTWSHVHSTLGGSLWSPGGFLVSCLAWCLVRLASRRLCCRQVCRLREVLQPTLDMAASYDPSGAMAVQAVLPLSIWGRHLAGAREACSQCRWPVSLACAICDMGLAAVNQCLRGIWSAMVDISLLMRPRSRLNPAWAGQYIWHTPMNCLL